MAHCIPSTVEGNPHASEGNSPLTTDIRAHSWFNNPLLSFRVHSCPFVVLSFSCPFVPIRGSLLLNGRAAEPPRGRAQARHPRTTFSFLLPSPYFGSPLHSDHALPSPFFSLLPSFVSIRVHSWFNNHLLSFRALSWFKSLPGLRENWENIVNPWEL